MGRKLDVLQHLLHLLAVVLLFCALPAYSRKGIELDADGISGRVMVRGLAILTAGETLVLSSSRDYSGKVLARTRSVRVIFDGRIPSSLTVQPGAKLLIEGQAQELVELQTEPPDAPNKGVLVVEPDGNADLKHVSFVGIALRIGGSGDSLSHVAVQYAGNQAAFTFEGATGTFDHLFAHHSSVGFLLTAKQGKSCRLVIRDSEIRSCSKGSPGSTYLSGGAIKAVANPIGAKHSLELSRVDWDPSWDEIDAADLRTSGQRPRIVTMGDSIAQGCCKYVNFWNYLPGNDDIHHSWPYQLQQRTSAYFVINKAEGGFVTGQMLAQLPSVIKKLRPRYCYLGGGTNDLGAKVPPGLVVRNFETMWKMLKAAGVVPVQLAITPNVIYPERESEIVVTNALLREAAQSAGVRYEDTYSVLAQPSGWGLDKAYDPGDGLHLNLAGYQKIGRFLWLPEAQSEQ